MFGRDSDVGFCYISLTYLTAQAERRPIIAASVRRKIMDDTNASNVFEWWGKAVESSIPFWKSWDAISESQKSILENYRAPLMDEYQKFIQLAPNNLSQTINPWSFSLFQITQQMKSSNPAVEYKIVKDVAGYGSQLGTIMDFLGVLDKMFQSELAKITDPQSQQAIEKFRLLATQIKNVKESAQPAGA
jgi:hypothetical protein